jgi:hypothetical protein
MKFFGVEKDSKVNSRWLCLNPKYPELQVKTLPNLRVPRWVFRVWNTVKMKYFSIYFALNPKIFPRVSPFKLNVTGEKWGEGWV